MDQTQDFIGFITADLPSLLRTGRIHIAYITAQVALKFPQPNRPDQPEVETRPGSDWFMR
jgi:hypothetical protein